MEGKVAMKLLQMLWVTTFLATTLVAGGAQSGGRIYCEHPKDPFAAGSYEIVVEPSVNSAAVAEWIREDVARIMSESPPLFEGVTIDVVEMDAGNDANPTEMNAVPMEQYLTGEADGRRAYVVLDQLQSDIAALLKQERSTEPVVSVPGFDASKVRAELGGTVVSESEYYREAALHAALTSMLYWNGEHNDRVADLRLSLPVSSSSLAVIGHPHS